MGVSVCQVRECGHARSNYVLLCLLLALEREERTQRGASSEPGLSQRRM